MSHHSLKVTELRVPAEMSIYLTPYKEFSRKRQAIPGMSIPLRLEQNIL
jgi:hypothetical protein